MSKASNLIVRVVPPGLKTTKAERDAILEIAYLAVAADHKLSDDELDALSRIASKLHGAEQNLNDVLGRFGERREQQEVETRLRELGASLSPAARSLAYRVAYALAMCDLDTSDEEFEFDLNLIDALDLTSDQAAQLADEVQRVLQG